MDTSEPRFEKHFNFEGVFPGTSPIAIEIWDYDQIFGDDLIGSTSIDLEDRFFTPTWTELSDKPIEFRRLYHKSSTLPQGVLKCWVEITPQNEDARRDSMMSF